MTLMQQTSLVVFYGLPLGQPTDTDSDASNEFDEVLGEVADELREEHVMTVESAEVEKGKAGLFEFSNAEVENTMVVGVVLEVVDLIERPHHLEISDFSRLTPDIEAQYESALAALPRRLKSWIKKYSKGKPRVIALLASEPC